MSGEHLNSPESTPEISAAEHEQQLERLRNNIEREGTEADQAKQAETARDRIERQAEVQAKTSEDDHKPRAAFHPTKLDKTASYNETMRSMRRRLKPASRAFSKVIHTPVVEKASEIAGATVFRPSVTLGATATALLLGGSTYLTARHYGFGLSGSEFVLALLAGGLIGLGAEGLSMLFRHKQNN